MGKQGVRRICGVTNLFCRLRWFRREQRNTERLRQVAFAAATSSLCPLGDSSFELQHVRVLGRHVPRKQTVPRVELLEAIQVLK